MDDPGEVGGRCQGAEGAEAQQRADEPGVGAHGLLRVHEAVAREPQFARDGLLAQARAVLHLGVLGGHLFL